MNSVTILGSIRIAIESTTLLHGDTDCPGHLTGKNMNRFTITCLTRRAILPCLLALATMTIPPGESSQANEDVYNSAIFSTVAVYSSEGGGSGVLIDREQRLIVSNHHVTGDDQKVLVFFPIVQQGQLVTDEDYYLKHRDRVGVWGTVLRTDKVRDIALIQVDSLPDHAVAITIGQPLRPGDDVHSIGNPESSDAMWIYTHGYVRANYYREMGDWRMQIVETSSPINPGDSGGPMLNDQGELVGISQSMWTQDVRLVSNGVDITEITWFVDKVMREQSTAGSDARPGQPETGSTDGSASSNSGNNLRK